MPALLLPNQILSLPAEAADRLLARADGDAALLYLALLRHGEESAARKTLNWAEHRFTAAFDILVKLALAAGTPAPAAPAPGKEERDEPPAYTRGDLTAALGEDDVFRSLSRAVEGVLGKTLSDSDLIALYTMYDFLSLPAEVIYLLVRWCADRTARRYGPGRPPRMPEVKKEAFRWKRMGLESAAAAEEYLAVQSKLDEREREILPLLGIRGRLPVDRERQYIAGWVDMGFADDAIVLAYETTVMRKGNLNWAYMNSILKNWHAAGLHTAAQVREGDRKPAGRGNAPADPANAAGWGTCQPSSEEIRKSADWLDRFLADQQKKGD